MMLEAYSLSLVAVIGTLAIAALRAQAMRPGFSVIAGVVGAFFLGYAVNALRHPSEGTWNAGTTRAPAQHAGVTAGETVAALVPGSVQQNLPIRRGDKISTDVFDVATAGVLANHLELHVGAGSKLQVSGWAADSEKGAPCKAVYLVVAHRRFSLPYGFARSDVAAYYHDDAYLMTGYSAQVATDGLAKGSHEMTIECLSANGKTLFASTKPHMVVVE